MNLFTIDFLDAMMDYLVIFLIIILSVAFYLFLRALDSLNGLDSYDEERINRILFKIERKLEDIESKHDEYELKMNFVYKKCIEIWQDKHEQDRKSKKS